MRFSNKRLRLATRMIGALVGLSSLALSRAANKSSAQSLLPLNVPTNPGVGAASAIPLTGASAFSAGRAASILEAYARPPLSFEPRDQSPGQFFSRGLGYNLAINSQEIALTLRQTLRNQHRATRREMITSREDEEPSQIQSQ